MYRAACGLFSLVFLAACGSGDPASLEDSQVPGADSVRVPLMDLGTGTYLGFQGGLYPNGSNDLPSAHAQRGAQAARQIQPLDASGRPSANGAVVLLSIGMSNTTQEFCSAGGSQCVPWSFSGLATVDPDVRRGALRIVNGAAGGQVAENWDSADEDNYRRIQTQVLAPQGLGEAQVQIVWLKVARREPTSSLPSVDADAYRLQTAMGDDVRALKARYPNLRQIFISSRIYAGFASSTLNPEPYAYESGLAVKWLIESQIRQLAGGGVDARSGDLSLQAAPWLAWGPYLWARDASAPRSDGLFWVAQDYQSDGTHPGPSGEEKVGRMLLAFFKTSPHARCWFLIGQTCG